jgi:hypothetical protein
LLENLLVCDWLAIVKGPSYLHPFPFYHDSFWIRTPSSIPLIQQTCENLRHFIRLYVISHLRSDTFRGRLDVDGAPFKGIKGEFAETVVVKYAATDTTIAKLKNEYHVIQTLRAGGVNDVPKVIGLFFYQTMEEDDIPAPMAALVLEDAGEPVNGLILTNYHM